MNSPNDKERLVEKLLSGVDVWNQWRAESPNHRRLNLSQVKLAQANLRGVDLTQVFLDGADFSGADLRDAQLNRADLLKANFQGADLRDAQLNRARLLKANLEGANLSGADLRHACLYYIKLRNTILSRKTQINQKWRRVWLLQSDKEYKPSYWFAAELNHTDLQGVDLSGMQLPYADLRGTNLKDANLIDTDLSNARVSDETEFKGAKYSSDTILPHLSPNQQRSLILVKPQDKLEQQSEVLVDLESLKDERTRINFERVSRPEQQKFREMLLAAYQGKCAISACDAQRALDGAHIFPYQGQQTDQLWNGIVLRLDLHRLFDSFLLTIDSKTGQVCLSPSLINSYQAFALIQVRFPEQPMSQNRQRVLRWHNAKCSWFQAE